METDRSGTGGSGGGGGDKRNETVVVISDLDSKGRPRTTPKYKKVLPGNERRPADERAREDTRLKKGERRERFFADDDVSLDDLGARIFNKQD